MFSSQFSGSVSLGAGEESLNMTAALRDLYTTMDKGSTIPPIILLQVLHMAFPRFAERGENGGYQQQDANECWMEVLRMLQVETEYLVSFKYLESLISRPRPVLLRTLSSLTQLISFWESNAAVRQDATR